MTTPISAEIRAARADEMPAFIELDRYVFAENDDQFTDIPYPIDADWTTCAFVDGRIVAAMATVPFAMHWNGAPLAVGGVTAVGTDPGFRRRGLLRRVMEQSFREQRERGQSLAILWASMGAIYQRFGYGLAATHARYQFDPREVALRDDGPVGMVHRIPADEALAPLQQAYGAYAAPRNFALDRDFAWKFVLRQKEGAPRHVALYRDGAGTPTGYVVYGTREVPRHGEPAPDQEMTVHEFVAPDVDAFRALWSFIRAHDLVGTVHLRAAEDDPAPALLLEPRSLRRRTSDAIWMRVVDVERALPQRPYAEPGALTLAVRDPVCDWNDGAFRLESDRGGATVRRASAVPDLSMPVRSLASLASGHYSATQLARWGLLEAHDPAALRTADRMFATEYRPYCLDDF